MSCGQCGGLNQIATLNVPGIDGEGSATDVSSFTAQKSVEISGDYQGSFTLLGSHDGSTYVPVLSFQSGAGTQSFKQTMPFTLHFLKVRRRALIAQPVTISIGGAATCDCS